MAKNRKATNNNTNTTPPEEQYLSDYTGELVPMGDLKEYELLDIMNGIEQWIQGYTKVPEDFMSQKQVEYIYSHFQNTTSNPEEIPDGHVYRIENAYHFKDANLKEGDTLKGNGALRSFSKKIEATNKMMNYGWGEDKDIVIYRTIGKAPFFNATKYANPIPFQEECFVPPDTMKVAKISEFTGSNMAEQLNSQYGLNLGNNSSTINSVTVVDIEYDSTVKSVKDYFGREISTENINI